MKSNEMTKQVTEKLNQLLSDLQMVYQNQRTLHWLITGHDFQMLHNLYEEYYTETADVIDEVAERILMLGGVPLHTFNDYIQISKVEAISKVSKGKESLKVVVDNYEYLLKAYRELLELAGDNNDEGTLAMLSDLIAGTEKKLWMLKATIA